VVRLDTPRARDSRPCLFINFGEYVGGDSYVVMREEALRELAAHKWTADELRDVLGSQRVAVTGVLAAAWYVLVTEACADPLVGLTEPLDPSTVRMLLSERRLAEYLIRLPVRAGDTVIAPAGTLHAIGSGILLYEIQEQSDITYRFYDWGRTDSQGRSRPLHIEEGLTVLRPERRALRTQPLALDAWRTILTACRYFLLERWEVDGERHLVRRPAESPHLLSCIAGSVTIATTDEALQLTVGRTALLPAPLREIRLGGRGTLLAATVPDLWRDVVVPLRAAGYPDEAIARLGGDTSDLAQALSRGADSEC
jgi:mannose-6-phosphate isomerase